jgi:hypothetical protein
MTLKINQLWGFGELFIFLFRIKNVDLSFGFEVIPSPQKNQVVLK